MRFAYLILAHRDLDQLEALIERLLRDDAQDRVVLHVDARTPVGDGELKEFASRFGGAVSPTSRRIACRWGHPSLCEAELALLEGLEGQDYDYAHLLSGQDWPLRPKDAIVSAIRPGAVYLTLEDDPMPERMEGYQLHNRLIAPGQAQAGAAYYLKQGLRMGGRWIDGAAARAGMARGCPFGAEWKKGSQWWSLPHAAVEHVVPRLESALSSGRLRHTLCSDEHVVQTILAYSPFAGAIEDNRRFILWNGESSPETLTSAEAPALAASDAWYGRKFDRARDPFFLAL